MSRRSSFKKDRAAIEASVQRLSGELADARRDLERVTAQRDELRRVIGDLRSYARQEAERAVVDNLERRGSVIRWEGPAEEMVRPKMRPTVALAAHLRDPEPPEPPRD